MRLIHLISSNHWGGAWQYALDLCSHFLGKGWKVTALTCDAKAVDDRFRSAGVGLRHAPLRGLFDPASALILSSMLKEIPAGEGIVHVHRYRDAFTALLARRLAKRPDVRVVATRHSVRRGRDTRLFRRIYRNVDAHIFVSHLAYDAFRTTWEPAPAPLPDGRVHIIHNSLNLPDSPPPEEPEKGPVTAMYHGPLVEGKGLETIIDALVSLRDLKMRMKICGKGSPDFLDKLRRRAMTRGVMEMIDWNTSAKEAESAIAESHFGVQPSMEREAFGLENLRYMRCGRAQVCCANGAQREFLADGVTALFVPPADAHALAEAMRRLASDQTLRRRLGENARKEFDIRLSWDIFTRRMRKIYYNELNIEGEIF